MLSRLSMLVLPALLAVAAAATAGAAAADVPPSCDRKIYCNSELLQHVQLAGLYSDSKTFVDMRLLADEDDILNKFSALLNDTSNAPSKEQLTQFVNEYFAEGEELDTWSPPDFISEPTFLARVRDPDLRQFGRKVNAIWPTLGRRVRAEVSETPGRYSLLPLPNGFVVPGGRFKEIYYWDSYWVIEGLLVCGMRDTARGMIENLIDLVRRLGHVPNGSRVYYEQRSQPPLLTAMARMYVDATGDNTWLRNNIDTLESELQYWLERHAVSVGHHTLLIYNAPSTGPRPESYREDYELAQNETFKSDAERTELYIDIKSAAESGWDFSTRWFANPTDGDLSTLRTRKVVPVDLNAIFAGALQSIGDMRARLGNRKAAAKWRLLAARWRYAIERVLWNEADGVWYDYDSVVGAQRRQFYPSNVSPLWARAVEPVLMRMKAARVFSYLTSSGGLDYPGGVPTSLEQAGEQWDFPNGWPPLQSILIGALENGGHAQGRRLALSLANTWIRSNYRAYNETGAMYEKYDVRSVGGAGGGGEYEVQAGFGWTNGVVIELLNKYGDQLSLNDDTATASVEDASSESDSTTDSAETSSNSAPTVVNKRER